MGPPGAVSRTVDPGVTPAPGSTLNRVSGSRSPKGSFVGTGRCQTDNGAVTERAAKVFSGRSEEGNELTGTSIADFPARGEGGEGALAGVAGAVRVFPAREE